MRDAGLRVLIVEDELLIRWSIEQSLNAAGHTVLEACDGASARRVLGTTDDPIDVVLLDYRLPDSNDLGLLRDVRRLSPASAVVMMTAYGAADVRTAARELGVHNVIDKPFDLAHLDAVLQDANLSRPTPPALDQRADLLSGTSL